MRLAELVAPYDFRVLDVDPPVRAPGEVLVDVEACGVCASELDSWEGRSDAELPRRIGHEVSGVVAEADEGSRFPPGTPVAVWTLGSGYAEQVSAPEDACRALGDFPVGLGLLEPVACAVNAVELADVRLADDVVVVGAGFMGSLVQQLVALRGPRSLVVVDRRPDVLALAAQLGATRTVDSRQESAAAVVAALTDGRGADVTFEVTGVQGGLDAVTDLTRMSGKVVLVGFHQGAPRTLALGHWNWMGYDLRNAHFREPATIMRGMDVAGRLLAGRRLDLAPLVTHRFPLERIGEAFATAVHKPEGFVKAVVTMPRATSPSSAGAPG
ncbi:zinc-binding dehydrogenase [Microlunatus flavus]|uniref:Threonine dehydrogenase n=1 Tax=Microlunatus flavus TaxID=1036181 RepID=A0A1H9JGY3_9ACTN|nr:zinc-binding dehydrogenase [Microlunatus flavus]SEQ86251.1 Threonine dehydrogenase [Microlunatus flavus]